MNATSSQNWAEVSRRTPLGGEPIATAQLDVRAARQIAHNVNNLLAVIGGHADILLEALPTESPLRRSLSAIQESTARAGTLTRKLFEIAKRQPEPIEAFDPTQLFLKIGADAGRRFGHRLAIDMDSPDALGPVRGDSQQMERAISTIVSYAIDAMPYGGQISFRAADTDVMHDDPCVHVFVKEGRYVRLDIVCSRRLGQQDWLNDFEPIRERAARDGVDLALVFGQIKRCGGYLWIGTDESSGETALTMLWPAA